MHLLCQGYGRLSCCASLRGGGPRHDCPLPLLRLMLGIRPQGLTALKNPLGAGALPRGGRRPARGTPHNFSPS